MGRKGHSPHGYVLGGGGDGFDKGNGRVLIGNWRDDLKSHLDRKARDRQNKLGQLNKSYKGAILGD